MLKLGRGVEAFAVPAGPQGSVNSHASSCLFGLEIFNCSDSGTSEDGEVVQVVFCCGCRP